MLRSLSVPIRRQYIHVAPALVDSPPGPRFTFPAAEHHRPLTGTNFLSGTSYVTVVGLSILRAKKEDLSSTLRFAKRRA